MPELPEVEVVRAGVDRWATGRRIASVAVFGPRVLRRYPGAPEQFAAQLQGRRLVAARRRGKFLWFELDDGAEALAVHLGMSGQLVLPAKELPAEAHLRVRIDFDDDGPALRFVDQRTFGWVNLEEIVPGVDDRPVAASAAGIAPDVFEASFDDLAVARRLRSSTRMIKAAMLDQSVVSGIGNIYADEALWRARRHWATPCDRLTVGQIRQVFAQAKEVMAEALVAGGTSFDSLYVNVNGESGYFSRDLNVYGREGLPCRNCGRPIVREAFANRSSYRCPRCQRRARGVPNLTSVGAKSARSGR